MTCTRCASARRKPSASFASPAKRSKPYAESWPAASSTAASSEEHTMSDHSIRPITIAEQAHLAAQRHAETGEAQTNPHPQGSEDALRWDACFRRAVVHYVSPESEGGA